MGNGFCQLQPFTIRQSEKGENAVLAILQKFIFYTRSTHIFPDGALTCKAKIHQDHAARL